METSNAVTALAALAQDNRLDIFRFWFRPDLTAWPLAT
jgi:hypothetical protein